MADTHFGLNHPLAVKIWSKKLYVESRRKSYFGRFIGEGDSALIQEKTELKKSAGDKITCGLRLQLTGDGIASDNTLEGNEEALGFQDDAVTIDQLRHATRHKGRMSAQRVPYNLRAQSNGALSDWWSEREETVMFNQLCGNTAVTDGRYTGFNPILAPSGNRHLIAGGHASDDLITSADIFTLEMIDVAQERAKTSSIADGTGHKIRPIKVNGKDMYVCFLHDYQVSQLRRSTDWQEIQLAAMQGGDISGNPLFTGALGVYNNTILHAAPKVTKGVSGVDGTAVDTVRRAAFCGAQALTLAYGGASNEGRYTWVEEEFDYGDALGVAAGAIWGMKKTRFKMSDGSGTNEEDFGSIVISSYAAPSTI